MMPVPDEQDRLLREARKLLRARAPAPIWRRTVKPYQADFGRLVRVELTRWLRIRVVDPKSGEVLSEGPALGPESS
mgnify:CR=1 FL=1